VQRIWRAHQLQPHRLRTFKRSRDPGFATKLAEIVGLYVDPSAHAALVLSIDEKSQIQALDRTQPGLTIKPGRCQTMTHDYKRHGTTTLFAALSVLDGTVIGRCMQRHRHLEFIRFLNAVEREVPAGKVIHTVLDNYATHKHPKVPNLVDRIKRMVQDSGRVWPNSVGGFGPDEGFGAGIVLDEMSIDSGLQVGDRVKDAAADALPRHLGKEVLDGVEPRRRGRGEVERWPG
jgi:hypothetical protein